MTVPAYDRRAIRPANPATAGHRHPTTFDILPGEKIGRPLANPRHKAMRRVALVLVAGGIGWLLLGDETRRNWLMSSAATLASAILERHPKAPPDPRAVNAPSPAPLSSAESARVADANAAPQPATPASPAPPQRETASTPVPATPDAATSAVSAETEPPQPLPPPRVSASDPLQLRAMAVGLHPEISRVVLSALTETDFRNAGIAIKNALEQTPDGEEYLWPRQREPRQALFKVHFVQGAPVDCRRYVVTVIREGWSTTALPMEKCGIARKPMARK